MENESDLQSIESIRTEFDSQLMNIPGIVSVSTSIGKDGKPCLKISTSLPIEEVQKKLPEELFRTSVELEHIGEVHSQ